MCPRDLLEAAHISCKHARAHDVAEGGSRALKCCGDIGDSLLRLHIHLAVADNLAALVK
jgi:hypothetical protein